MATRTTPTAPAPHANSDLKLGVGISVTSLTLGRLDAWVNQWSSSHVGRHRITRGDVVSEMAAFLVLIGWRPGMTQGECFGARSVVPPPELKNGVVAARPAKAKK